MRYSLRSCSPYLRVRWIKFDAVQKTACSPPLQPLLMATPLLAKDGQAFLPACQGSLLVVTLQRANNRSQPFLPVCQGSLLVVTLQRANNHSQLFLPVCQGSLLAVTLQHANNHSQPFLPACQGSQLVATLLHGNHSHRCHQRRPMRPLSCHV